jgi:hypothetical protein
VGKKEEWKKKGKGVFVLSGKCEKMRSAQKHKKRPPTTTDLLIATMVPDPPIPISSSPTTLVTPWA